MLQKLDIFSGVYLVEFNEFRYSTSIFLDCPIFPVDDKGEFIFPLDESNCPIPALRPDGQPVIPKDEYGNFVIPKDRKGKPLIHIADDGVTPMSLTDWKQWKQYCRANKAYLHEVQQQQQMQAAQQQHQAAANYTASGVQMSMVCSYFRNSKRITIVIVFEFCGLQRWEEGR